MPDDQTAGQTDAATDQTGAAPTEDAKSTEEQLAELTSAMEELKKNSRKWEDRAKSNADKAKQFDALQAATATEADKLKAIEDRATAAERELARYRVVANTGLPVDLAELLTGDEDSMEEQAKKLLARIAPAKPKPTPKPDPAQGGGAGTSQVSAADEGRQEAQRRAALRKKS